MAVYFSICVCIYPCPQSPEDSIRFLGAGALSGCVIVCDCWELNSARAPSDPCLYPQCYILLWQFLPQFLLFSLFFCPSLLFFVFSHCWHLHDTLHHMWPFDLSPFFDISWPPLMISCLVSLSTHALYTLIYIHKNMKSLNQHMRENKTCKVCVPENWVSSLTLTKPFGYRPRRDIAESH